MFHVKHFCSTEGRILFHVKHGIVACEANGICADAARAHKRVDTCGFHPLVNHPFPLEGTVVMGELRL